MSTVTVLLLLFLTATIGYYYQNTNQRNNDMLDRGYGYHENNYVDNVNRLDRFSPIFSVDITKNGEITEIFSTFNMDFPFYIELISNVLKQNRQDGTIFYNGIDFKYKTYENEENGSRIVFLDISKDIQTIKNMIYFFIWISLPLLGLIFLISKYFADKAIKPIQEGFDRQNQFIADASHEIRTPLATINANATVLLDSATDEQKKWLCFIKDETIRMEKLTSGLLYLSREPLAKSERVKCNLSQIVNGILMPLEAVLFEKKIECEIEIEENVNVMASEEQLRRLVGIFVENAVKYTENKMSVKLSKQSKNAVITLSNNGSGIAGEDFEKIWDRFYRTDKARKHRGGFGLGLAMAKSIANELGCTIKVSSTPDVITTFTITMPTA